MYFIAAPEKMRDLDRSLRVDPRVIKWTTLKLGHRPEDMVDIPEKTIYRDTRIEVGLEMEKRFNKQMLERVREL